MSKNGQIKISSSKGKETFLSELDVEESRGAALFVVALSYTCGGGEV